MDDIHGLGAVVGKLVVGDLVDLFDLVSAEDKSLNRPIGMLDVVNLGGDGCDDAEIVTGTLESPHQLRLSVNRLQRPVRQHYVQRKPLVHHQPSATLEPTMTTSEGGTQVADAFTCPSYYVPMVSIPSLRIYGMDIISLPVCFPAAQSTSIIFLEPTPPPILALFPSCAISTVLSCSR